MPFVPRGSPLDRAVKCLKSAKSGGMFQTLSAATSDLRPGCTRPGAQTPAQNHQILATFARLSSVPATSEVSDSFSGASGSGYGLHPGGQHGVDGHHRDAVAPEELKLSRATTFSSRLE